MCPSIDAARQKTEYRPAAVLVLPTLMELPVWLDPLLLSRPQGSVTAMYEPLVIGSVNSAVICEGAEETVLSSAGLELL
jgi:hypothetical protein